MDLMKPQTMRRVLVGVALLWMLPSALTAQDASLTRKAELPPIRWSQGDLIRLVATIEHFAATSGAGDSTQSVYRDESLTVSDQLSTYSVGRNVSAASLRAAPPVAYAVSYALRTGGSNITAVSLDLSDYRREVTVSGHSPDQVAALLALIQEQLKPNMVWYGGAMFRLVGEMLIVVCVGAYLFATWQRKYVNIWLSVIIFAAGLSAWVLPWQQWFPGTVLFAGDASVLERYAPQISFAGLVVTVLGTAVSLYRRQSRVPSVIEGSSNAP